MLLLNPRRSRRRHRRANRSFHAPRRSHRRHRRNSGFVFTNPLRGSLGTVTKGFSAGAISQAVPLAVGALANRFLQDKAADMIGSRMGYDLSHGWKNTIVGTATAGALGMVPKYGGPLFAGAMMQTMIKALLPYIPGYADFRPAPPPPPPAPPAPAGPSFSGLGRPWIPAYSDEGETHHRMLPHPAAMRHPAMRGKHPAHAAAAHAAMHGMGEYIEGVDGDIGEI